MSSTQITCLLHLPGKPQLGAIKPFDDVTWKKVHETTRTRNASVNSSKYHDVSLPPEYNDSHGYHSECYKNYTAVRKLCGSEIKQSSCKDYVLRSEVASPSSSSSGIFHKVCIFCDKVAKYLGNCKRESLGACEVITSSDNIRVAATRLRDDKMLAKLAGIDFIAKEVKYHHSCRRSYLMKADKLDSKPSVKSEQHDAAFSKLKVYVKANLIDYQGAETLASLHKKYMDLLDTEQSTYPARSVALKLLKAFPDKLCEFKTASEIVISNMVLSQEDAFRIAYFDEHSVRETALYLRKLILSNAAFGIPDPVTAETLAEPPVRPLEIVKFFRYLFSGSEDVTDHIERQVNSITDDAIFITTRGRAKPGKHLSLGLGLKSMTGSRKIIEVLNRFGHCVNYHLVETLETEMATAITQRSQSTPDGMRLCAELNTALAWDNYDENNETLSGSNTLHDTVGICYQNISQAPDDHSPRDHTKLEERNKHRAFKVAGSNLEPYRKKAKITQFNYESTAIPRPLNLTSVEYHDILWMMSMALGTSPMWVGWNSLVTEDTKPKQKVLYMENLNLPPTRLDVVAETLRISQRVAAECDQPYIVVHYDLAIAKPALQLQCTESPMYDNVFVAFGPFHIAMAYFAVLGHLIESSGGPEILTECEVLAPGSLNSFLKGKHYNRCKRLYPMLAIAFHVLHFRKFLDDHGGIPEDLTSKLALLQEEPSPDTLEAVENMDAFKDFMQLYGDYTKLTLTGSHGSTAQFWIQYVQAVQVYLKFDRACRTNDLNLFIFALGEMRSGFFAANRPNYARYMVRYYLNLLNIDKTHPGVREVLENGALSIRRTDKNFSRTAVDLTLEQTVNADAASRLTGIAAFGTDASARQRWMITRSVRSAIVSNLLSMAGLRSSDDTTKDLKPYRIRKDNEDLQRLEDGIQLRMNPFTQEPDKNLYCLSTAKNVTDEIRDDLLNYKEKGESWCKEFLDGCIADPLRFEKPIKRRKVKNFSSAAVKSDLGRKGEIAELRGTRDLFGRLLYLGTVKNISLDKVFCFPLTPVPLSLAHTDGSMNKTDKAKLMHKLEAKSDCHSAPRVIDVVLVDAVFMLHTLVNLPSTFGEVAATLLRILCDMSSKVHLVCDTYMEPSLKDSEHQRRGADGGVFSITGPEQKRPQDWQKALRSPSFKTSFLRFLCEEWTRDAYVGILTSKEIYIGLEEECYSYTVVGDVIRRTEQHDYICQHEEADTRLIYHMNVLMESAGPETNISVRANDTDVLVLLMYHVERATEKPNVWMDVGLSSINTRHDINITELVNALGSSLVNALPALHAFTGTDVTTSFMNKGKVRPLEMLVKSEDYRTLFASIGEDDLDIEDAMVGIQKFVCALYGVPKLSSVDEARYAIFQQRYAPKKKDAPLDKIKGINPSNMPPCKNVLRNKLMRAHLLAALWKKADTTTPSLLKPDKCGWDLIDGSYNICWYSCRQMPEDLVEILSDEDEPESDDENADLNAAYSDSEDSDVDEDEGF